MAKRIEYIDAMRGFTMFLVVLVHSVPRYFLYEVSTGPLIYNTVFSEFRMPLFFFVSGFVFYKAERKWDLDTIWSFLKKKIPVQIITPAIFMLFYFLLSGIDISSGIFDMNKRGYWFTFSLFEFFILFILSSALLDCIRIKNGTFRDVIMTAISFLIFLLAFNSVNQYFGISDNIKGLIGLEHFSRYPFFVAGVFSHKYFPSFEKLLDKRAAVLLCAFSFISLNIIISFFQPRLYAVSVAFDMLMAFTGVVIIFFIFRKIQFSVSHETRAGRIMQYVGKHTLDIYLIHFFVLFAFYKCLDLAAPLIQGMGIIKGRILLTFVDFIVAVLTVTSCLGVSKVIRIVPFVNYWMFGASKKVINQ